MSIFGMCPHCDMLEVRLTQSKARIRELEDVIRKFLEADMELDDKLSYGEVVPTKLSQAVKEATRGLLDIMPLSEKSDKEIKK